MRPSTNCGVDTLTKDKVIATLSLVLPLRLAAKMPAGIPIISSATMAASIKSSVGGSREAMSGATSDFRA